MDISDIKQLALTARIIVSDEEAEGLLHDLAGVLKYIDQVNTISLPHDDIIIPDHRNAYREDVVTNPTGSHTDIIMSAVASKQDGYVKVKKIL
jgi:aspartyl/glutamyl-tRNA(Asn/Gln) amidotransferase C subunit